MARLREAVPVRTYNAVQKGRWDGLFIRHVDMPKSKIQGTMTIWFTTQMNVRDRDVEGLRQVCADKLIGLCQPINSPFRDQILLYSRGHHFAAQALHQ